MKFATMLSAATLIGVLALAPAQAQAPGEMSPGGPPAAAPRGPNAAGPGGAPDLGPSGPGAMQDDGGAPGLTGPRGDRPGLGAEAEGQAKGDVDTGGKAGTKAESKGDLETGGKAGTKAEGKGDLETGGKAGTKAEGDIDAEGKAGATAEGRDSRDGKAGKSVKLESQQVSKVRSYFSEHKPSVKAIDKTDVKVSIGIALPSSIVLYDLPPDVIVVGGPCTIRYFVWGDDIVLVDSCTREVVEIIAGVA
ncbi:MAG TPA: DUF1236 domain-containing protein [Methyloceanibacter sp.]|jgi:hypothetical protein|nr:DUF1236 domain-containing protein [Methyloceanibacter sp.]